MANEEVALLYARVSTQLQVNDGVSLDVQERQLQQAAETIVTGKQIGRAHV